VTTRFFNTPLELFHAVREYARQTEDPSYRPVGGVRDEEGQLNKNRNGKHAVPWECYLKVRDQFVVVPLGSLVIVYQDVVSGKTISDVKTSVGTLFLQDLQITLRGNGSIRYVDLIKRAQRTLCSLGGYGRSKGTKPSSVDCDHFDHRY